MSISEIKSKIVYYRLIIKRCEELNLKSHDYYKTQGFLTIYEVILAQSKQISLNEKDIEKKARDFYWRRNPNKIIAESLRPDMVVGYYQALKELL